MNDEKKLKHNVVSGLMWTFGERILAQLVSTVVGIVLARILMPEDYGVISIVMIFISICNVFVTSGFGAAIVQKKEASELDFNTAFFLSLAFSIILYAVLFVFAPFIADFYEAPLVSPVIRVLGLRLILASLNSIQQASIRRQMKFKRFFLATIFGTVSSCVVGIALAYAGFGAWALVAQYLSNTAMSSIIMCFVCGWNPKFQFSRENAKSIFSVSWKLLCAQLISTLSVDIRSLFVGKAIGTTELAYYDQGLKYPSLLINNLNSAINTVMLPAYSKNQDNLFLVKNMLRKSIRVGVYLVAPIMIGLFAVAENFVLVLLTEKWRPIIPLLQIFCFAYLTRPLEASCHQAVIAIGRSDLALKIMIAINVVSISATFAVAILIKKIVFVALVTLLGTLVSLFGFMISVRTVLNYKYLEQIQDITPPILIALIMGTAVYALNFISISTSVLLVIQVMLGMIIYLVLSLAFKLEGFTYIKSFVLKRIKTKA